MLQRLFPRQLDNTYNGRAIALWLFAGVQMMKVLMGVNCIVMGETVARSADGIPIDTFTPAGVRTVVALFAVWGVTQLVIVLVCLLALLRYRAMVPLLFFMLLFEFLARKLVLIALPIADVAGAGLSTGTIVNWVLFVVILAGSALSLMGRDGSNPPSRH